MPSILVTGVSSGIGNALMRKAVAEGWNAIGTVRDDVSPGAYDLPDGVALYRLDLKYASAVENFAERLIAEHGVPDVVVNNAGYTLYAPIEETSGQAMRDIFEVNALAPITLIQSLLPAMRARGSGVIVNITSLGGRLVFPFFGTYNASKHALEGFSEGLWHELQPFGVKVKAVEPGYVDTPIYKAMEGRRSPKGAYGPYLEAMNRFSEGVTKRTSPERAADEVWAAIVDSSDRLRYPVAAYARVLLAARRVFGDLLFMRFMHKRWMGK
jgi:NAD(P)-dependent dehydrogenase (short-subunit alcohol dehydrogenase family)